MAVCLPPKSVSPEALTARPAAKIMQAESHLVSERNLPFRALPFRASAIQGICHSGPCHSGHLPFRASAIQGPAFQGSLVEAQRPSKAGLEPNLGHPRRAIASTGHNAGHEEGGPGVPSVCSLLQIRHS